MSPLPLERKTTTLSSSGLLPRRRRVWRLLESTLSLMISTDKWERMNSMLMVWVRKKGKGISHSKLLLKGRRTIHLLLGRLKGRQGLIKRALSQGAKVGRRAIVVTKRRRSLNQQSNLSLPMNLQILRRLPPRKRRVILEEGRSPTLNLRRMRRRKISRSEKAPFLITRRKVKRIRMKP